MHLVYGFVSGVILEILGKIILTFKFFVPFKNLMIPNIDKCNFSKKPTRLDKLKTIPKGLKE